MALRQRLGLGERLGAADIGGCQIGLGDGAFDIGLGGVHRNRVGTAVDGDQQIVGLYDLPVAEVNRLEKAGDTRPHLDRIGQLEAPGELVLFGDRTLQRHGHRDHRRRRLRAGA